MPQARSTPQRDVSGDVARGNGRGRPALMTQPQIDLARRTGERLQAELRALVRSFPVEARTIVEMSRWLGVTRPVCQRLLRAIRHRGDPLTALSYFPGLQGLHQIVQAARRRNCDESLVAVASAAVDQYAILIDEHGSSQTRLLAALATIETSHDDAPRQEAAPLDEAESARQSAFESIRVLTRREFQTHFGVYLYRPRTDDPQKMDCITAMGMIGVRRRPDALPICPTHRFAYGDAKELEKADIHVQSVGDAPLAAGAPLSVLDRFCSKPLPHVVARQMGGQLPVLIDPDRAATDPFDVVLGTNFQAVEHPACHEPRLLDCSLVSEGPSQNLVMSVHLHRSLAQASIPTLAAYMVGNRGPIASPDTGQYDTVIGNLAADRWFDRLPDRPRLEHLGMGLDRASCPAYPRLGELAEYLCNSQGWNPDEFVGYQCQVTYPLWGAQYLLSFEFGNGDTSESVRSSH